MKFAYRWTYEQLARQDAERAWQELPDRDGKKSPADDFMVEGFFRGLKDGATFAGYVERLGPVNESLAVRIAAQWMRHDIEAAQNWAPPQREAGVAAVLIDGVQGSSVTNWAFENPAAAIDALRVDLLPEWRHRIASGAIGGNPQLASEVVEILARKPGSRDVYSALHAGISGFSQLEESAHFPEPALTNRKPDQRARYESFLEAIAHDGFTPQQRASLRKHLDRQNGELFTFYVGHKF